MLRSVGFALSLAFSLLLFSASVSATTRPRGVRVRLDYERGAGAQHCPDEKALREEIAAELGDDFFTEPGPWQLRVSVVRRKNGVFAANAEFFDSDGATWLTMDEMVDRSCQKLMLQFVSLWIEVALTDPPLPPPPVVPCPAPALPSSSTTPPALACAAPSLPPPSIKPPVLPSGAPSLRRPSVKLPPWWRVGAGVGVEIGVRPTLAPLLALSVGFQVTTTPLLSMAFELRTDLPVTGTGQGGAPVLSGAALACVHVVKEGFLFGCPMIILGVPVGGARSEAAGSSDVYAAAGARVGIAIPFASRRFSVSLAGDVLGTIHSIPWTLDEEQVGQTGPLTGAVQAGVSTFF